MIQDQYAEDEVDLFELIEVLLAQWKAILATVLMGLALGAGGWFALAPYKSSLMLLDRPIESARDSTTLTFRGRDSSGRDQSSRELPKREGVLTFVEWRRLQPVLNARAQAEWQDAKKKGDVERTVALGALSTPEGADKVLTPVYAADKSALKNLGNLEGVNASDILAVNVSEGDRDAERLLRVLSMRAAFVQRVILDDRYRALQDELDASLRSDAATLRQERAELLIEQRSVNERLEALKSIQRSLPELNRLNSATVLDPKGDNAKFLPIAVQVMALETDAQKLRGDLRDNQEALTALEVRTAVVAAMKLHSSEALDTKFQAMRELRLGLQTQNQTPGTMRDLEYQNIDQQLAGLINARLFGLVAGEPLQPKRSKFLLTLALAGLASGFVAVLAVFVMSAWRKRKAASLGSNPAAT